MHIPVELAISDKKYPFLHATQSKSQVPKQYSLKEIY